MNPKIYWTTEMEAALIELVAEKPHLWDSRNKNYVKKSLRNDSLQEICAMLQARWPDHAQLFTHESIINKFATLRSYFRREWKTAQKVRIATGTKDFVPKWEHYIRLSFLEKVTFRSSKNRSPDVTPMDVSDHSDDSEATSPDIELDSEYPGTSSPRLRLTLGPLLADGRPQRKKLKRCQSSDESSNEDSAPVVNQYFKDIYRQEPAAGVIPLSAADIQRKNALDLAFCRYLNTMLSPIPDCLQKELAKIKITETILKLKFPQA